MSAWEHLSPGQFPRMPIDQILRLPAADARHGGTVADVLPRKERDIAADPHGDFRRLRASMQLHGQTYPIHIDPEIGVGNGCHRIVIARQLGWHELAYSHDIEDSGEEFDGLKLHDIPGRLRW